MRIKTFLAAGFLLSLFFANLACESEDPNFSNNVAATLNITGNYNVVTTPDPQLKNFTLTQTGSLVQGVDNRGTVYEGTTTGDITTIPVNPGTPQQPIPDFVTSTITLQGTQPGTGKVITIVLTSANLGFLQPEGTEDIAVTPQPPQQTNVANLIFVKGLAGTYTDNTGLTGVLELSNNSLQFDEDGP